MGGTPPSCPRCQDLELLIRELTARVARLEADLAAARKTSADSSEPPSSDIVKPPEPTSAAPRRRGAQPGHAANLRPPFAPGQIDTVQEYRSLCCPDRGGTLAACADAPRVVAQVESVERPIRITEHRGQPGWCPTCRAAHHAPIPEPVRAAGLVGPHLTTLVAYLKGGCHCPFSTIRKFLRDVVGVRLSRGWLARLCAKVSAGLQPAYDELLTPLPQQARLNVDETGHKDDGQLMWTWCFRAELFTLFKIAPSRGSAVLLEVLGAEFDGVLGCDYFGAYRKYMGDCGVAVQFCLAHLIRDLKFLAEHPDPRNRTYGRRLLGAARALFAVIHRREQMAPAAFARDLEDAGNALAGAAIARVPATDAARNLAGRCERHGDSYLRFITTPGIEPTNNLAEQAIRFVVLDRVVTHGSRGDTGQRWSERIGTTLATCARQGRSAFEFLRATVAASFAGIAGPSLLPNSS
jgi:transposase